MTFDVTERSNYDGKPISLYEFSAGSRIWRYCSGESEITIIGPREDGTLGLVTFKPVAISDAGIKQSSEVSQDQLTIRMPTAEEFCSLFTGTPPSVEIWVVLRRIQAGETDAVVSWIGTLASASQRSSVESELRCTMLTASFNRNGLRLSWSRNCPHALYDRNCRVDKAAFAVPVTITALTGVEITVAGISAYPSGYFSNGFLDAVITTGLIDRRAIEFHSASVLGVLGTTDGLKIGDQITLFPGCNRTILQCRDKFNNTLNYGGFPHLPGKSPFDGTPVF